MLMQMWCKVGDSTIVATRARGEDGTVTIGFGEVLWLTEFVAVMRSPHVSRISNRALSLLGDSFPSIMSQVAIGRPASYQLEAPAEAGTCPQPIIMISEAGDDESPDDGDYAANGLGHSQDEPAMD